MSKGRIFLVGMENGFRKFKFLGVNQKLKGDNVELLDMDTNNFEWVSFKWFIGKDVEVLEDEMCCV
jgi:hypothetical protein